MSVRETVARNTTYNAAGRILEAVISLVLARYIVGQVGLVGYGVWAIVGVFTGYVALFDFGLSSAFVKYIAEHAAREEHDEISAVVSTGFLYYLVIGALLIAIGWPCVDGVMWVFSYFEFDALDAYNPGEVRFLLRGALILFATTGAMASFTAVQTGLQRMGITNALSAGASLVKVIGTIAFLEAGLGLRGLLFANACAFGAFAAASVVVAFRLVPGLRVSPATASARTFRQLFAFGWQAQIAKLSNLIMLETDLIVTGLVFKQSGLVGLYKLGVELANKMRQVPTLLLSALVPAASSMDAREEEEQLQRLYVVSTKYVAAVGIPLALFTVGCAGVLMRTWMGPREGIETAAWVLRIMALGYIANIVPGAGVAVALGKGRPDLQMKAGVIATVSNILLTITLVLTIGFWGIPIATAASLVLSWAWFAHAMKRIVNVGPGELLRTAVLWPLLASLPGLAMCLTADYLTAEMVSFLPLAATLCLLTGIFFTLYLGLIHLSPFLDAFDRDFLANTLSPARRLRAYAEKDGRGYPDWAVRYLPVLRTLRHRNLAEQRILEIGANESGLARFARVQTIVVDIEIEHLRAARAHQDVLPVVADIAALPFRPGTFDVAVCMDTFEHVPETIRDSAASEITAVLHATGTAVVAFPSGEAAERAEQTIRESYHRLTGGSFMWLDEHERTGLPNTGAISRSFEKATKQHHVVSKKNANLRVWKWMWRVLMCGWPGRGNAIFQVVLRLSTPLLARLHFGTCYRSMIWLVPK
jgi:O-antigen/teichoic acid export membrane protein